MNEISRRLEHASAVVGKAAEEGLQSNEKIQKLSVATSKIGEVVALINQIASQTNLLALNATIEAARAGESGRGFAVVASEVKTLATQTAKATDEIRAQISAVQAETTDAVLSISRICRTIQEVDEISGSIASSVGQQDAATREIASNVQAAAARTDEVTRVGMQNPPTDATRQRVLSVSRTGDASLIGFKPRGASWSWHTDCPKLQKKGRLHSRFRTMAALGRRFRQSRYQSGGIFLDAAGNGPERPIRKGALQL